MKQIDKCSKCGSTEVVRVPGECIGWGGGNYVRIGLTFFSFAPVSRFVCIECGFVEEWVDSPGALRGIEKKWKRKEWRTSSLPPQEPQGRDTQ